MRRIVDRLGPRGLIMLVAASAWVVIGVGVWRAVPRPYPGAFHALIPHEIRAAGWIITAAVAIVTARYYKWSSYGIGALLVMPCIRVLSYLGSWLMWLIPGVPDGAAYAYYAAASQLPMVLLALACVYLTSGPEEVRDPDEGDR